jgi:hypothetical protein
MIHKIISGGQTGADRAALDFAIQHGIPHGGWCLRGRLAEDGIMDARYHLTETPEADPTQRTEWNVRDSDATVIISIRPLLEGGSRKTQEIAMHFQKPFLHISRQGDGVKATGKLMAFCKEHQPLILNIAGPRASEELDIAGFVREVLELARAEIIK